MSDVDALIARLRRKASMIERGEKTPYVADVMRQAANALAELSAHSQFAPESAKQEER